MKTARAASFRTPPPDARWYLVRLGLANVRRLQPLRATRHVELERLTLDKLTMRFKERIASEYADLIYNGLWYSPLRSALDAFIDEAMQQVTGEITLELYKGNLRTLSRYSPFSLYDKALASYTDEDTFDHRAGEGFSKIFALPLRTIGRRKQHHAIQLQ